MVRCRWQMTVLDQRVRVFVLILPERRSHVVYSTGHAEYATVC